MNNNKFKIKVLQLLTTLCFLSCSCSRPEVKPKIDPVPKKKSELVDRIECNIAKILKSHVEIWSKLMRELSEDLDPCNAKDWDELMYWAKANDNLLYDDMRNTLLIRRQSECTE